MCFLHDLSKSCPTTGPQPTPPEEAAGRKKFFSSSPKNCPRNLASPTQDQLFIAFEMVNVANPNFKSKNRLRAHASKARKVAQKAASRSSTRIEKADAKRGARPGLLPTSGPRKQMSAKKQRKLEKKLGYAMKRKMEAEGEVVMKGAPFDICLVLLMLTAPSQMRQRQKNMAQWRKWIQVI